LDSSDQNTLLSSSSVEVMFLLLAQQFSENPSSVSTGNDIYYHTTCLLSLMSRVSVFGSKSKQQIVNNYVTKKGFCNNVIEKNILGSPKEPFSQQDQLHKHSPGFTDRA